MSENTKNVSFSPAKQSAFDARYEAQKIAFSPVVFQCVHYALKKGILDALAESGEAGISIAALAKNKGLSVYALTVSLETCLSAGLVKLNQENYVLDKVGYCFIADKMTQVNFNFIKDVCYLGLDQLEQSLDKQKPHGLKQLGEWPTIYQGLSKLKNPASSSWFEFDHYYSDTSFPEILPDVFATAPKKILDIGANTGKFAAAALNYNASVILHLVDLPQQLELAKAHLRKSKLTERAKFNHVDMLDESADFPSHINIIWMSQFLSCFSEAAIISILTRAASSLAPDGQILILDTFWDRQQYDIAAFCLINTSPYFTVMASGNSKVYRADDYIRLAKKAGLNLVSIRDNIGYCHSLLRFNRP